MYVYVFVCMYCICATYSSGHFVTFPVCVYVLYNVYVMYTTIHLYMHTRIHTYTLGALLNGHCGKRCHINACMYVIRNVSMYWMYVYMYVYMKYICLYVFTQALYFYFIYMYVCQDSQSPTFLFSMQRF